MALLPRSRRAFVEEIVDLAGGLGADAGNLRKVGDGRPLDRLQGSEMMQQRALAGRTDAGNLLQSGLADVPSPPHAMGADRKTMRLVAQALDEIEHGVARLELERLPARQNQGLHPGIPLRPLGD